MKPQSGNRVEQLQTAREECVEAFQAVSPSSLQGVSNCVMSEVSPHLPSRGPLDQMPRRISVELPIPVRDLAMQRATTAYP
jgi:hypothetical protein